MGTKKLDISLIFFHPKTLKCPLVDVHARTWSYFFIVTIILKTHGNVCDYDTNLQVDLQQEDNKILECPFEKHHTLNISHNIVKNSI